jgi:Zn finger protein HypA/HybF involved in hydrogenase expression
MRKFIGILKDDEISECLECKHESKSHAEFEVDYMDEAEVVCPKCHSSYYFLKVNQRERVSI